MEGEDEVEWKHVFHYSIYTATLAGICMLNANAENHRKVINNYAYSVPRIAFLSASSSTHVPIL